MSSRPALYLVASSTLVDHVEHLAAVCLRLRRFCVFDDEDFFAGLNEAELPACDFFNGGWILAKTSRLLAKPGVLGPLASDGGRQFSVFAAHAQHRQQPAVAGKRVEHDHGGREKQQSVRDRAAVESAAGSRTSSGGGGSSVGLGHRAGTVLQSAVKYNS